MSILPHTNENDHELNTSVSRFIKDYKISKLLRICRAEKEKGVPIINVFQYLLCLVFSDRSMYMQIKTNAFKASFSKNTVYRFLNSAKTNWLCFTTLLSEMVVNQFMRDLTSDEREDAFIIDDTLHAKAGYKKTELVSKVFDHVTMKYKKGFRLLTVGWGMEILLFQLTLLCSQAQMKKTYLDHIRILISALLPVDAESKHSQRLRMY